MDKKEVSPDREKIYQQYAEQNNQVEKESEVSKEPEIKEPEKEAPTEQPPIEVEKKEEPAAEETKEEPTEDQKKKELEKAENLKKALDEERLKRKRLREEKEALEAKLREYEERHTNQIDEQPIVDYETELKIVKKKLMSIELMEARREELARQDAINAQAKKLEDMVKDVDKSLADEGYPGFKYLAENVRRELIEISKVDPEEAQSFDNPEGWQRIFKEKIYPRFKEDFDAQIKKVSMDKKKELKKEANLTTSVGKPNAKTEDDNPENWSTEKMNAEYIKMRRGY